jgi:hypothetical protein
VAFQQPSLPRLRVNAVLEGDEHTCHRKLEKRELKKPRFEAPFIPWLKHMGFPANYGKR